MAVVCIAHQVSWTIKIPDACGSPDPTALTVKQQCYGQSCWTERTLADLTNAHLADPSKTTVIYIHGWRATTESALRQANAVYGGMTKSNEIRPMRFVYIEWFAEKTERRYKKDYIKKSHYSLKLGGAMASILEQFQNRDITLVGHSLGSQVILSLLTTPTTLADDGSRYKTAFLGSALNCEFGSCISNHGLTFPEWTSNTLVFNNYDDFALKVSNQTVCRKLYRTDSGRIGEIVAGNLVPLGQVSWIEVHSELGCRHDVAYYVGSSQFPLEIADLLGADTSALVSDR